MKASIILLIATFFVISNPILGQNYTNVKVNHLTVGDQDTDGGNSIAVVGSNIYLLWQDMNSTYLSYVSKSTDGGVTFGNGVQVSTAPLIFGSITSDNDGSVYVALSGLVGESINGIYFAKSTDQAQSFSPQVTVSADGIFASIAVYGSNVYVSFYKQKPNNKIGYFFAKSTNGGTTFETPYEISDAEIDNIKFDSPSNMSIDNSGNIYCVWNDGRRNGTGTDIYLAKSTDNGVSFGTNIRVNDISGSSAKIRTGPSVAAFGSNVYVAWRQEDDDQGSNRLIMFGKSSNGGTSFSAGAEKVIAIGGWGSPSLTVNSIEEIYIAYPQYTSQQNGLFCSKSNDQGVSFPTTVFISGANANAQNPSIVIDADDTFYSVWSDNRSDDKDVYFSKGKITIVGVEEEANNIPTQFELMQNYPNPFNPTTMIRFNLPISGNVTLKVFDLLGKEVAVLVNEHKPAGTYEIEFNGMGLSSGVYFYQITAGNFVSVKKFTLIK
ncbi:MAG: T9SS type A sorting domain-containing protein [Melioribacteraceae bacterium]|nr:T9SS type A sorting domain-containing protein [Melioribacteraceae bacterium]